jgi:hypothetical protein
MKLNFPNKFSRKSSNIKFHENPSSGSRVVPCGQTDGRTDMTKLIVPSRNLANAAKNSEPHTKSAEGKASFSASVREYDWHINRSYVQM